MSNQWLWLTAPIAVISLVVLPVLVVRLVEAHRGSQVLSVPLLADQEIIIETAGRFLLHAEGPRGTRAFGGLDYQMTNLSDRSAIALKPTIPPSSSSGVSRSRLSLRAFELAGSGRFRLTVSGISDPHVSQDHNLVVTHNRRGGTVGLILGIVFSGIGLLGGLVSSILIYLFNR